MNYKIGLVGLPNVGKSSLFSFLTKKDTLIANYPFATIDKSVGMMLLKDQRLDFLNSYWKSEKVTSNLIEIFDIAGLVKDASKGMGLGNEFLSNIREVDLILHVVRCFDEKEIIHVEGKVDPIRDYEIIQLELILADLQQINNRLRKLKEIKENQGEKNLLIKIKESLEKENLIINSNLTNEEKTIIKGYNLLTNKPFMIISNYGFDEKENYLIKDYAERKKIPFFSLGVKLESDIEELTQEEKKEMELKEKNLSPFYEQIKKSLNLKTFLTVGKDEVRSWLVKEEFNARECGGAIHSDIRENFIRVEIYNYQDWLINKNDPKIPILIRKEGSNYLVKEGDICYFLFGKK